MKIKICRNINLSFVVYGCETWCLTLRKEHWLRVFENRVNRKILASKRDEVTGDNEQPRKLYCSPIFILLIKSRMRLVGHVARVGDRRGVYKDWWGDMKEKRQSGRPRCCWERNIQSVVQEMG